MSTAILTYTDGSGNVYVWEYAQPITPLSYSPGVDWDSQSVSYTLNGSPAGSSTVLFYNISDEGGFTGPGIVVNTVGPQVYGGTEAAPTFSANTYLLTDQNSLPAMLVVTIMSGAIGWSPKDCRQAVHGFGPGPNTGVIQNSGADFYIGQMSDNSKVPGTDSRIVMPADSRIAVPINSRVSPNGFS